MTQKTGINIIYSIIFITGFTFLIYEVSWNRMLSLVLGATVAASTIVLVAFMAGLSVGAFIIGKLGNRSSKPGKLLSLLLIGIGFLGFVNFYILNSFLPGLYQRFENAELSAYIIELIVYSLSILLLFFQTVLMGGILPVVSKFVIRAKESISSGLGKVYAFETLGSAVGGFLAGFVLLGIIGQQNTIIFAVTINLISGIFLFLSKSFNSPNTQADEIERPISKSKSKSFKSVNDNQNLNRRIALPSTFVIGFSIMALQVIWMRMYKVYLTNTSYTFALISSLIIVGFFVGSWLFKNYSHKMSSLPTTMLKTLIFIGIFIGFGLLILVKLPELIMFPFEGLISSPFIKLIIMPMIAALLVVFPPALISGFAFPLACTMLTPKVNDVSKGVGTTLTLNSLGSAIGPVLAGFIFIPYFGAGLSVIIILFIVFTISIYVVFQLKSISWFKLDKPVLIFMSALCFIVIILKPQIKILPPSFSKVEKEILFYKETVEASLVVSKEKNESSEVKTAYVNNAVVIGSTYDAIKAVKMIGHLPFFTGLECKDALIVGFGIGVTAYTIASHQEVKSIDCIELAGGLKEASRYFNELNGNIINDPRLNFIPGDGRHYLQHTTKKYDLISSDPTHPILGSANLYSQEYFELCKSHLTEKGMVSQYLPLHKLRPDDFQGIIKTFQSVFTETTVWLGHTHAILIGSKQPITLNFQLWERSIAEIGRDPVFYSNPYHLAASLMLDKKAISEFDQEIKINSDDHSYLEFFSPACFDEKNLISNLAFLSDNRIDINRVFVNIFDPFQMGRFIEGNQLFIKSSILFQEGKQQQSLDELRKAVKANPENQEYPFLIKFYYHVPG